MGTLFIVATPIGNLGDCSPHVRDVLASVGCVVCEDTRVTKKLFVRFGISTQVKTFHQHSDDAAIENILRELSVGTDIAYVTDAGTPGVADPGGKLVAAVRVKLPEAPIVPIPGSSAIMAALSVSGLPADRFTFLGFPPHKKGRETYFRELGERTETVVFFESVHRILKCLQSLADVVPDRTVVICRELTKMHEEIRSGTAQEHLDYYTQHPDKQKGEFVLVVGPGNP